MKYRESETNTLFNKNDIYTFSQIEEIISRFPRLHIPTVADNSYMFVIIEDVEFRGVLVQRVACSFSAVDDEGNDLPIPIYELKDK